MIKIGRVNFSYDHWVFLGKTFPGELGRMGIERGTGYAVDNTFSDRGDLNKDVRKGNF